MEIKFFPPKNFSLAEQTNGLALGWCFYYKILLKNSMLFSYGIYDGEDQQLFQESLFYPTTLFTARAEYMRKL